MKEMRYLSQLRHPNIVETYEVGVVDGQHFIAMEYIDGKNLGEIISALKQGLPFDKAAFIISQICKGLDYSHSKKDENTGEPFHIVHRDISPQNLMVNRDGVVKLVDFGIAKVRADANLGENKELTKTGSTMGTPYYMAPEQFESPATVDHRADVAGVALAAQLHVVAAGHPRGDLDLQGLLAVHGIEGHALKDLGVDVGPGLVARVVLGEVIGLGRSTPACVVELSVEPDRPGGPLDRQFRVIDGNEIILRRGQGWKGQ